MRSRNINEAQEILEMLAEVKQRLTAAYSEFNSTLEPELIEASVFEINSLQARYAYLFRKAKDLGGDVEAFRFPRKTKV